jgi:RNA polymerase sigma-70 factor (ECF subfamily)
MLENKKSAKELFRTYSNDVFRYSLSILKDYEDAKDAVQDVFMQFLKSEDSFRGECSSKTWLLTLTRNYCYKKLIHKSNGLERIDENLPDYYEMSVDSTITLNDALVKLSKEDYELIYLREYAGYSYLEISEILGISLDNVKIKLFRARQRLKEYLE